MHQTPPFNREKSPRRNKSSSRASGLHPTGALARTHRGLEHKTQSRRELLRAKSRQNLRESARTPLEGRGLLSDIIKRGTLSKNRKNCLDLVNIEAKRQPRGLRRFSDSPEAHPARPRTRYRFSASPERPRTRYRFSASLKAGSAATPSPPPRPRRHVQTNATNHSRIVSRPTA